MLPFLATRGKITVGIQFALAENPWGVFLYYQGGNVMLDINVLNNLAELSKLSFTQEELEKISSELDNIIKFLNVINDFNAQPGDNQNNAVAYSQLRQDKAQESFPREQILKNAKEHSDTYFKVPKVV